MPAIIGGLSIGAAGGGSTARRRGRTGTDQRCLFSPMILERFPAARLTLVDGSTAMLDRARERFGDDPSVAFRVADLATCDLEGPWDAIVSALAIHHLEQPAKKDLFARIRSALAPGGLFVNAEQVLGPTPEAEDRRSAPRSPTATRSAPTQCRGLSDIGARIALVAPAT